MLTSLPSSTEVIEHALNNPPSLIIDCANAVNPHAFQCNDQALKQVFVVQAELLYTFRDVFKEIPAFTKQINTKTVCITSFHRLFNYQNQQENNNIYDHAWKKMKELSNQLNIVVAVHKTQEERARKYCDKLTQAQ